MNKIILTLVLISSFTIQAQEHTMKHHDNDKVVVTEVINGAKVYGTKWVKDSESMSIDKAISEHEMLIGDEMVFKGNITKVCQKRGCWMMLESHGKYARVDFNHHSFFIPKDTQGSAEVFGVLHSKTMSDKMKKHLESEGAGKLAPKVFEITATSVKINHIN